MLRGGQGHAGCGLGAERRRGEGRLSQDPRGEGGAQRMRRLGPWALQTHASEGGGREHRVSAGSLWLHLRTDFGGLGEEQRDAGGSTRRLVRATQAVARLALRGGRPERWSGSCCVQANQNFFFLRHGSQAGGTVWPQSWGRLESRGLSRPAPSTVMLLFSEGGDSLGLA